MQFSGTWRFPRPLEGERDRVRGCPGTVHDPHPSPLPGQGEGAKGKMHGPGRSQEDLSIVYDLATI